MKLKIFAYTNYAYIEEEFNDWVKNNPNINIEKIECTECREQYTLWLFYSKKNK